MKMHRRDILKLLAASATIPLGGVDLLWNSSLSPVSNAALGNLEDISTVLASKYHTSPPHMLLGPVMGHLEKATAFLSGTMQPSQRQRLESIVADTALFAGTLSMASGKLAQARAHFGFTQDMAQQAGNMALLAQAYAKQALLDYYAQAPSKEQSNPRTRIALLEQADQLASRYAPAIVQTAISSWLAEDKAAAKDGYGADQALERSRLTLEKANLEGPVGTGFCSSAGYYHGWDQGDLQSSQGLVELSLHRSRAVSTLETSLPLRTQPRGQANSRTWLAIALITQKQPEEACACLTEAHTIGLRHSSVTIFHHIFSARALMPPPWSVLRCVRELDERLREGWTKTNARYR
jgi:hypothetical protein